MIVPDKVENMKHLNRKIRKVLIANRGEIALRIQRACHALKIATVSIASEADKNALHARKADKLVIIGPASARESYLAAEKIVAAARESGCDAVHPGYGFLSEDSAFAQAVIDAGLVFIGPTPEAIRIMGNKTEARSRVIAQGVPCSPGCPGGLTDGELEKFGEEIGFPIILKASAGGGGRGMRIFRSLEEIRAGLPQARAEVQKFFGSSDVFLEKYIEQPRHVEVQVFGDHYGNVVHLGTRDCSTQRRHQKLVEEAPAPNIPLKLREKIHKAAVAAAKSVGYTNAGTCEFLLSKGAFYFLEMNTRIQVEHPVTEEVTGVDLVQLQIKVAMGEKLPFTQKKIKIRGHAIEFRVNAEDPSNNFAPARGALTSIHRYKKTWLREDFGYEQGDEVPLYYDGLISKLIVKGRNRLDAIRKSREMLSRYTILGVPTSLDLDRWLIENGVFKQNPVDIGFIERVFLSEVSSESKQRDPNNKETVFEYFRRELQNRECWDPHHSALQLKDVNGGAAGSDLLNNNIEGGFLAVEDRHLYEYESKKFKTTYTIEVLHRRDGFFLATPVDNKGRRAQKKDCRMSNGLDMVVRALINDVLEKTPPAQLFAGV